MNKPRLSLLNSAEHIAPPASAGGPPLFSIVLAGGDGNRMSALTELLFGRSIPKQYAPFWGGLTLLQRTLARSADVTTAAQTVVVVTEPFRQVASQQLGDFAETELLAQPDNRGTGPGVLLPLARVLARDPEANVVIFPSDHHIEREAAFSSAVRAAVGAIPVSACGVVVVGARPTFPSPDLGWIVRGNEIEVDGGRRSGAHHVLQFLEKPPQMIADHLQARGALCNTLIIAARARALWDLARRHLPRQARALASHAAGKADFSARGVGEAYRAMPPADFSRSMLESARGLAAVEMADAGWSDWGTPESVLAAMKGNRDFEALLYRASSRVPARSLPSR